MTKTEFTKKIRRCRAFLRKKQYRTTTTKLGDIKVSFVPENFEGGINWDTFEVDGVPMAVKNVVNELCAHDSLNLWLQDNYRVTADKFKMDEDVAEAFWALKHLSLDEMWKAFQDENRLDETICPDCKRLKADSLRDVLRGGCPKYWAVNDNDAYRNCTDFAAKNP